MGGRRETILLVDATGELAIRLDGTMLGRQIVKCARTGNDLLGVLTSLRFDVIVLHHPSPEALEKHLLPALGRLAEPPRVMVVADRESCTAIAARFGVMCVREPADSEAIVAAIELVRERDLRVDRP